MKNNVSDIYISQECKVEVTFIKDTKENVNKVISLDDDGKLKKEASATITTGDAYKVNLSIEEFAELLDTLPKNVALILGRMDYDQATIVSGKDNERPDEAVISRSQDNFKWHSDYQLCMFDYDDGGRFVLTPEEFIQVIERYLPGFAKCKKIIKPSTGANIYDAEGTKRTRQDGFHIYFLVNRPDKIGDVFYKSGSDGRTYLNVSLWNAGFGYIKNSKPKDRSKTPVAQLPRTIYDLTVFSPERLVFEARPTLKDGLVQKDIECVIEGESDYLDLSNIEAPSDKACSKYLKMVEKAKADNKKTEYYIESNAMLEEQIRRDIKSGKYKDDKKINGKNVDDAVQTIKTKLFKGSLSVDYEIKILGGKVVTIQDILSNPIKYHKKNCHDPHEPDYGSGTTAIIYSDQEKPVIFSHAHGGKNYYLGMEDNEEIDYIEYYKNKVRKNREEMTSVNKDELVVYDKPDYVLPFSRVERSEILKRKCLSQTAQMMLLYSFEGFGKSYLAYLLTTLKHKKVVFASLSNEQSAEQAAGFQRLFDEINRRNKVWDIDSNDQLTLIEDNNTKQYRVQLIQSRQYQLLTKYGIRAVCNHTPNPWEGEYINEEETKLLMMTKHKMSPEEVERVWIETKAQLPDFEHYDIVCTTMKRVQIWGGNMRNIIGSEESRKRIIPWGAYIIYDDPGIEDFRSLLKWKERFEDVVIDGVKVEKTEVNGRAYAIRPAKYSLGYGFQPDIKMVITTTEMLTAMLIQRIYKDVYVPELMPKEKMKAGDITLIKSDIVRSKNDGVLPPILERLRKEGFNYAYIADGQGQEFNMVNSKGQNCLMDENVVVEVSMPRFERVTAILDEVDWSESDRNFLATVIAIDATHQAIGRNSGYRWSDKDEGRKHCIVIAEPKMAKFFFEQSRYYIDKYIEDTVCMSGKRKEYENGVDALVWFIANVNQYLCFGITDGRRNETMAFFNDSYDVIKSARDITSGERMKDRILYALKTKISKLSEEKYIHKLVKMIGKIERIIV